MESAHTGLTGELVQRDALADMVVNVRAHPAEGASGEPPSEPVT
jgi:hypothetical protein